jgi:hypothetical protein
MGSYKHPRIFLPLDLQIVEMVYDAAWTHIVSNDPFRDTTHDEERKEALREKVFALAQGSVDFDTLLKAVKSNISEPWAILVPPEIKRSSKPRVN